MSDEPENPDDVLALFLARGLPACRAAERVGLHERTVRRKLESAEFRARVDALRAEVVSAAVGQLSAAMSEAAEKLQALLGSDCEKVQLAAAREILGAGLKARQMEDLERQVGDMSRRLDALAQKRKGK